MKCILLQAASAELREAAAEGLGELVDITSEETLKPFVVQITGQTTTPCIAEIVYVLQTASAELGRFTFFPYAAFSPAFCGPDDKSVTSLKIEPQVGHVYPALHWNVIYCCRLLSRSHTSHPIPVLQRLHLSLQTVSARVRQVELFE